MQRYVTECCGDKGPWLSRQEGMSAIQTLHQDGLLLAVLTYLYLRVRVGLVPQTNYIQS